MEVPSIRVVADTSFPAVLFLASGGSVVLSSKIVNLPQRSGFCRIVSPSKEGQVIGLDLGFCLDTRLSQGLVAGRLTMPLVRVLFTFSRPCHGVALDHLHHPKPFWIPWTCLRGTGTS